MGKPTDSTEARKCLLCSYGGPPLSARDTSVKEKFAIWMFGRGWFVDGCAHEAVTEGRLYFATWFGDEEEARAVLASVTPQSGDPGDVGVVVTL